MRKINTQSERYDYTGNDSLADDVLTEVEQLDNRQRFAVHEAIQKIKRESENNEKRQYMEWFDACVLPALKEFAELTSSLLEIQRDDCGIVNVCLRNSNGLDITESCHGMYLVLLMAVQICMDADHDETILSLTYDYRKFVN